MRSDTRVKKFANIAARWFVKRMTRTTILAIRLVGRGPTTALFSSLAGIPLVRVPSTILFLNALQRSNRISEAIHWMRWVCARYPEPRFLILYAELLLLMCRFDEAETLINESKDLILGRRHVRSIYTALVDVEAMLMIERRALSPDKVVFAVGRGRSIEQFCYRRAWEAHAAFDSARVKIYVDYYLSAVNYQPDLVLHACDALLFSNALWAPAIDALKKAGRAIRQEDAAPAKLGPVHERLVVAYLELGQLVRAREMLAGQSLSTVQATYLEGLIKCEDGKVDEGLSLLLKTYSDQRAPRPLRAQIAGRIAIIYEERRDFTAAHNFYVSSFQINKVDSYVPPYLWRYVSCAMALNRYGEAAAVMDEALPSCWQHFRPLAKKSTSTRIRKNALVPAGSAFFVGCMGLGDDIIRMAMFEALKSNDGSVRYGLSCDPRMRGLYARSWPHIEVVPHSRMSGPFAVSEVEYLELRDGLPAGIDRGRVDMNVFQATKRYDEVVLTEDVFNAFIRAGGNVRRPDRPMLKVLPQKQADARAWLAKLPPGLNVGISWRSGDRNITRDKSYTDITKDWGNVLSVEGVNFINVQYSWEEGELAEAQEGTGGVIHTPDFDLKNDIEDLVALGLELDVVIAPCTSVRDMCAAAGATVWSLTTTPILPDLWRLDGETRTDRLFASMTHITAFDHRDRAGVLAEVGRRLAALVKQPERTRDASAEPVATRSSAPGRIAMQLTASGGLQASPAGNGMSERGQGPMAAAAAGHQAAVDDGTKADISGQADRRDRIRFSDDGTDGVLVADRVSEEPAPLDLETELLEDPD